MDRRILFSCVLPWLVAKKNKTKFEILPAPRGEDEKCSHLYEYCRWRPCPDSCFTNIRRQSAAFCPGGRVSDPGDLSMRQPHLDRESLFANPRLEFTATPTKQSTPAKSNRKYFAISHQGFSFSRVTTYESPVTDFLIDTPRLEFSPTRTKHKSAANPNRYKNALLFPAWPALNRRSPATNHKSRITTRAAFRSTIPARPHAYR
jgi:hypothetical protein